MRYFISQPMNGRTETEIKIERARITAAIKMAAPNAEIVSSFIENANGASPVALLGVAIRRLSDADVCVFADGWDKARGCVVERTICEAYGIPIVDERDIPAKLRPDELKK